MTGWRTPRQFRPFLEEVSELWIQSYTWVGVLSGLWYVEAPRRSETCWSDLSIGGAPVFHRGRLLFQLLLLRPVCSNIRHRDDGSLRVCGFRSSNVPASVNLVGFGDIMVPYGT